MDVVNLSLSLSPLSLSSLETKKLPSAVLLLDQAMNKFENWRTVDVLGVNIDVSKHAGPMATLADSLHVKIRVAR